MQVVRVRNSTTTNGPVEMEVTLRITTHDMHYDGELQKSEVIAIAALAKLVNNAWDLLD